MSGRSQRDWLRQVGLDTDNPSADGTPLAKRWVKTKLSEAPTEPPAMLVDGMIPAGMVGSIHAAGGEGKTLVAIYLALQAMRRGFKVAFLDKENGAHIMRERFEMMGAILPALEQDGLIAFYDHPTAGRDPETVAGYVAMLEDEKPDLLIIDAWVGFLGSCGFEENSATDIAAWADLYTTPARRRGIAVLLLDHTPKDAANRTARGSSRKRDYVDFQYELTKSGVIDRESIGTITLKMKKDRGAWLKNVHQFRVGGTAGGFVFGPIDAPYDPAGDAVTTGEQATLKALGDGGMTFSEWETASGETNSTFKRRRKALEGTGAVYKDADGLYWPTGKGPRGPNGGHGPNGPRDDQEHTARGHGGHHPKGGPVAPPSGSPLQNGSSALLGEDFASPASVVTQRKGTEDKGGSTRVTRPANLSSPAGGSAPGLAEGENDVVGPGVLAGAVRGGWYEPKPERGGNVSSDVVSKLLREPPEWLARQLGLCRANPDRYVNPTASSVAAEALGSAQRWREALPQVREHAGVAEWEEF